MSNTGVSITIERSYPLVIPSDLTEDEHAPFAVVLMTEIERAQQIGEPLHFEPAANCLHSYGESIDSWRQRQRVQA